MKKKFVIALLACILSASTVACGNTTDTKDSKAKQTTESKKDTSERDDSSNDEMSQAEWIANGGADNMEDGYEKVESINIDTSDISLKYTGQKIVDGTDNDGNAIKELIVYFDFTNKTSTPSRIYEAFEINAFQNGLQLINWMSDVDGDESVANSYENIMDNATLNVGIIFELKDIGNPVKLRIENSFSGPYTDSSEIFAQQQELILN